MDGKKSLGELLQLEVTELKGCGGRFLQLPLLLRVARESGRNFMLGEIEGWWNRFGRLYQVKLAVESDGRLYFVVCRSSAGSFVRRFSGLFDAYESVLMEEVSGTG